MTNQNTTSYLILFVSGSKHSTISRNIVIVSRGLVLKAKPSVSERNFNIRPLLQLRATRLRPQNFVSLSRARSMSGPVSAKSLRGEKGEKRRREFAGQ